MANDKIQENRLWNFRQIIKSVGGTNEAARMLGKKNAYITQAAGPNPVRNIGSRFAGQIETAFGLEPGALDMSPPPESRDNDPFLAELSSVMTNASNDDKEMLVKIAKLFAERSLKKVSPTDL